MFWFEIQSHKTYNFHAKYNVYVNVNWFKYTKKNGSLAKLNTLQSTRYKENKGFSIM